MKAFTARDVKTLKRTVLLYPTFQIFLIPLFIIGFCGVFFEPAPVRADQILPHMLMNMELPSVVVGLFCAGALAASMSSGDAMAHAAASIAIRDGLVVSRGQTLEPTHERRLIRIMVIIIMGTAYGVALAYEGSLVFLLLTTYGAIVQFAPAVVLGLYARWPSGDGVVAGLLTGIGLTVFFIIWPDFKPWAIHAGAYGLFANLLVLITVSKLQPTKRPRHTDEFLAIASGHKHGES